MRHTSMAKAISIAVAAAVFASALAFAEVNLNANGYDWHDYTEPEKKLLVRMIFTTLKVKKAVPIETGINILEGFYNEVEQNYPKPGKEKNTLLSTPCVNIMVNLIRQNAGQ